MTAVATTTDGATPAGATPLVRLRDVSLVYGELAALCGITLDVTAGEHLCVLGANGSGKSTLASVVCGLLAPDGGEVELVGQRCYHDGQVDLDAYRVARRSLGLVFQSPDDQMVTSIVEDDVAFGPENLGVPREQIVERVERELRRVAMQDYAKADPARLSGGQKQRVAIAGALAMEPQVLVLDEPGALLDVRGRTSIMKVMAKLKTAGTTVIHVTHFMEEALAADRVIVLSEGHIALEGTPHEVFSAGERLVELGLQKPAPVRLAEKLRALGIDVPWTCDELELREAILRAVGGEKGEKDEAAADAGSDDAASDAASHVGAVLVPGDAQGAVKADAVPGQDVAIAVRDLCFSYVPEGRGSDGSRPRFALDHVSFDVPRGSRVSLVGQTGSGKSTLMRIVCGLEQPDSGTVLVDGTDTTTKRGRRSLRGRVGYVMQHPERQLFAETVAEDVAYGPTNLGLSEQEVADRVEAALKLVGLTHKRAASPFELSGGQQRLCAIAGILAMEPQTILLDEPTAGLDPRGQLEVRAILNRLRERGVTVVQVTHSMEDAAHSDWVVVLNQSKVLMQGTPGSVFARGNARTLFGCGLGLPLPLRWARDLEAAGVPRLGDPITNTDLAQAIAHVAGEVRHGV